MYSQLIEAGAAAGIHHGFPISMAASALGDPGAVRCSSVESGSWRKPSATAGRLIRNNHRSNRLTLAHELGHWMSLPQSALGRICCETERSEQGAGPAPVDSTEGTATARIAPITTAVDGNQVLIFTPGQQAVVRAQPSDVPLTSHESVRVRVTEQRVAGTEFRSGRVRDLLSSAPDDLESLGESLRAVDTAFPAEVISTELEALQIALPVARQWEGTTLG